MSQLSLSCHITYRFERHDFVAMTRALTHRPFRRRLVMIVAWIAVFLIFLFFFTGSVGRFQSTLVTFSLQYAPALLIFALAVLFGHHFWAMTAAWVFKNNALANRDVELSFGQSGVEGGTTEVRYKIGWEAVKKIIETNTHLFLALSKREAVIVPRRAFSSDDAYHAARDFIVSRIGPAVPVARL